MNDFVNDYFKRFYPSGDVLKEAIPDRVDHIGMRFEIDGYTNLFPPMECTDGWSVSVQGHYGAYSMPRDDFADRYSRVELGFPTAHEPMLDKFQDGGGDPTDAVYGYVPVELVEQIIEKHGGLVEREQAGSET